MRDGAMLLGTLLLFGLVALPALGNTWLVEKDGSGDFTVIQECVNASSSGDTILVGAGRYDDWQLYGVAHQYPARVIIDDVDLTIIGSDKGGTIIGPQEALDGEHHGVALIGSSTVVVKLIRFENLFGGVMSWSGGNVLLENCSFGECNYGTYLEGGEGEIQSCDFSFATNVSHQVMSYYQTSFSIRKCEIAKVGDLGDLGHGIDIVSCSHARLDHCLVSGMRTGIQFDFGTTVNVTNCQIRDVPGSAVIVGLGSNIVKLAGCSIRNSTTGIDVQDPGSSLIVESSVFADIERATLVCNYLDGGYFRDNVLAKGERGVVLYGPHLKEGGLKADVVNDYDMRNNYWATDDPDSIQAWIDDNSDDPAISFRVLWEPFNDEPTPTQKKSFGGIKALFR